MRKQIVRVGTILLSASAAVFLLLQVLPIYGLTNPPVTNEPVWDSPETRVLAKRACFDCHSNETRWPWYAHVAPMRWLVAHDVGEARAAFNLSHWQSGDMSGEYAAEKLSSNVMPLPRYLRMHPDARLTKTERQRLANGLVATMK